MLKKTSLLIIATLSLFTVTLACQSTNSPDSAEYGTAENELLNSPKPKKDLGILQRAYFASGCFWCVEAVFEHVRGVEEVYNGYAGGHTDNPTYEDSNTGTTGHAEAVEVYYDSTLISFKELVDVYFGSQNIEQVNGQGNDMGSQYRSIAFYQNETELRIIQAKISILTAEGYKVASEVKKFEKFWMGEDYHQDYERLHPNQGYIMSVSVPRLNKFKAAYPSLLKENAH